MGSIISHQKKTNKVSISDKRMIEQAYGSDYPGKAIINQPELTRFLDATLVTKTISASVDLEGGLESHKEEHLSD